ncbi:SDR family NAD(P)-dependent oxidoreductase [Phytohabitans suffuscus]|uniref:3-oxoacyl-ACP reductase n=1 Tax=Phytohabitans suffuscus TaxID=624315 RepID=A0A6F8Y9Q1_9ACTN|nr:SDR family oxidoreductase [Phytohabitans suffuscus]BCB82753.1 3-oxoacyl-ACP reductase [Phytohabitans suffuscus]
MLLENRNAVFYGGGGVVGGGIARVFARHGARVFLAGRTRESLEKVAQDIVSAGGAAEVDVVDALDEQAVEAHADAVVARGGSFDVCLNSVPRGDVQGVDLLQLSVDDFTRPLWTGPTMTFLTARAAARRMVAQGSGVILGLTSSSPRGGQKLSGGSGPTDAAIDVFMRNLAAEIGSSGVRVLTLCAAAIPETLVPEKLATVNKNIELFGDATALRQMRERLDRMRYLGRSPSIEQLGEVAAYLASDRAGAMTATTVNATGGMFAG